MKQILHDYNLVHVALACKPVVVAYLVGTNNLQCAVTVYLQCSVGVVQQLR
jgi:hypothetical protein